MQTANVLLSLAGDSGHTVPKFGVTPSEVAVLEAIHGAGSVNEIEQTDDVDRSDRDERSRLFANYGNAKLGNSDKSIVNELFPGIAARMFADFAELNLPEQQYKADGRIVPAKSEKSKSKKAVEPDVEDMDDGKGSFE